MTKVAKLSPAEFAAVLEEAGLSNDVSLFSPYVLRGWDVKDISDCPRTVGDLLRADQEAFEKYIQSKVLLKLSDDLWYIMDKEEFERLSTEERSRLFADAMEEAEK